MCDMTSCSTKSEFYVIVANKEGYSRRKELCVRHRLLAGELASANLTRIVEAGPLNTGPRKV